jgi:hypothetical protein
MNISIVRSFFFTEFWFDMKNQFINFVGNVFVTQLDSWTYLPPNFAREKIEKVWWMKGMQLSRERDSSLCGMDALETMWAASLAALNDIWALDNLPEALDPPAAQEFNVSFLEAHYQAANLREEI